MEKDEPVIGYLTKQEIEHLATLKFGSKNDELYWDLFIFCCYTGLAYIDFKQLKWSEIRQLSDSDYWIMSHRQKTRIPFNIKLLDTPIKLMEKYRGLADGRFVFPVPKYSTYRKAVKRILKLAGIDREISTHCGRHSFATLLLTEGVPIESVSKILGHKNIKTTQTYAKVTNEKINLDMQAAAIKLAGLEKTISMAI